MLQPEGLGDPELPIARSCYMKEARPDKLTCMAWIFGFRPTSDGQRRGRKFRGTQLTWKLEAPRPISIFASEDFDNPFVGD